MHPADIDLLAMLKRVRLPTVANVLPQFIERAAAENWSHRDFLAAIIADVIAQAADPRYIRVAGKPLFLVYRPMLLPDPAAFAADCRRAFAQAGFPGVQLVYVESMEAVDKGLRPADIGFDASVEREEVGLEGDAINHAHDFGHFAA